MLVQRVFFWGNGPRVVLADHGAQVGHGRRRDGPAVPPRGRDEVDQRVRVDLDEPLGVGRETCEFLVPRTSANTSGISRQLFVFAA